MVTKQLSVVKERVLVRVRKGTFYLVKMKDNCVDVCMVQQLGSAVQHEILKKAPKTMANVIANISRSEEKKNKIRNLFLQYLQRHFTLTMKVKYCESQDRYPRYETYKANGKTISTRVIDPSSP